MSPPPSGSGAYQGADGVLDHRYGQRRRTPPKTNGDGNGVIWLGGDGGFPSDTPHPYAGVFSWASSFSGFLLAKSMQRVVFCMWREGQERLLAAFLSPWSAHACGAPVPSLMDRQAKPGEAWLLACSRETWISQRTQVIGTSRAATSLPGHAHTVGGTFTGPHRWRMSGICF